MAGRPAGGGLIVDVVPAWPFRLASRGGPDSVSRASAGIFERFLHVEGRPVLVRAWERRPERVVRFAAIPVQRSWITEAHDRLAQSWTQRRPAPRTGRPFVPPPAPGLDHPVAGLEQLELAIERVRGAIGVDDDHSGFYERFRSDPLVGPAVRAKPWTRIRRTAWPWEALAWAVTEQLIESERAHAIQRRITARWGPAILPPDRDRILRDVPAAATIASVAPAELAAIDLAPKRAIALIKLAAEIVAGRIDPGRSSDDRRLLSIADVGPWTVQVLGQKGRGEEDSLPAGDLAYVKLVGGLSGTGSRATVEEIESFYAPYAPYRGLAGYFMLSGQRRRLAAAPPLRYVAARPELEAA